MKFIFPILTILVCGAAAYFSFTQSEKFQEHQDARLLVIATNKAVKASADKEGIPLEVELKLLEESKKNLDIATASLQAIESDANGVKNDLSKVEADHAAQVAEKEQLNKVLNQVQQALADMNLGDDANENNLAKKIGEIEEDVKAKEIKNEELEVLIEGAKNKISINNRDEISRLIAREDARDARISRNALEARVSAVDSDWGFLVIGAGSNSGYTPQTTLLVKRDGRLIGKVTPSSIEPTQTIAEIDLKSISPGVRIQPGDSVIIAKPAAN